MYKVFIATLLIAGLPADLLTTPVYFPEFSPILPELQESGKTRVEIEISQIRNKKGSLRLGIFKNQQGFEEEDEYLSKSFSKSGMRNGKMKVEIFLPPGRYGIALLDDENSNEEMDYGFMMPEEGFGFSNYYHSGLSRPGFEDFDFVVEETPVKLEVKVKYM